MMNKNDICKMLSEVTTFTPMEVSKLSITDVQFLCKKFLDKNMRFVLQSEVDNSYTINETLDKYFYDKESKRKGTKVTPLPSPLSVGERSKSSINGHWDFSIETKTMEKYKADTTIQNDILNKFINELSENTDTLIRDAINKYLGNNKWTIEEVSTRGFMKSVNLVDYLYMDGTLILELYPYCPSITLKDDNVMNVMRKYRMHV